MDFYVARIDRLIPAAEEETRKLVGPIANYSSFEAWARAWNQTFHRLMDQMTAAAGLRRMSWQGSEK